MGKVRYILLFVAAMVFVTVFSYTTSPIYQVCGNTPDSPIFQIIGKYEHRTSTRIYVDTARCY